MAPRVFSVDEANALIPLLSSRFQEIQRLQRQAEQIEADLQKLVELDRSNGRSHGADIQALERQIEAIVGQSNQIIDEISDLGCEIKDIELGLVDFPSQREGRIVFLCWKMGEDEIRFWHELATGFAGRQPL